jgi:hypothetical protein
VLSNRIIKWRKLIVMVIVGFLALNFLLPFFQSKGGQVVPDRIEQIGSRLVVKQEVIDKKLVIKAMFNTSELVGMETNVEKSYTYKDSWFKSNGWIADYLGKRECTVYGVPNVKMGINLGDITANDVVVNGRTLTIFLPKPILISLNLPFDKVSFIEHPGLLRMPLSLTEKQFVYAETMKSVKSEIMSDKKYGDAAISGVKEAIRGFLEIVPNIDKVMFVSKP